MRNLLKRSSLFTLVFLAISNANAQCGPTFVDVLPLPIIICEGDAATMTFTANGTCTGGNWEFQVGQGAAVLQPWSTTASFSASPVTTTTYTVYARCSSCPATIAQEDVIVEVLEEPTISGITQVCANTSTTLTASGSTGTYEWYDAATGGNMVSNSGVLTTPTLTTDATYWVSVTGTSSNSTGGAVLITECGLEGFNTTTSGSFTDADYLELSNLYSTSVNTTGWVAAVSSSYTNINGVNSSLWYLPSSFAPCSILSKTDVLGQPNYWGSNILWNPTFKGWAIIVDNVGNVVDFVAWGWTAAELAGFNPTINGFSITLGTQWTGNGCSNLCGITGSVPYSISRLGNTDNNNLGDFTCAPSSLNVVNPALSCGWTANAQCRFPTTITVDEVPTASNPTTINVQCAGDVPPADINVVTDEADDFTNPPTVTYIDDVSNGLTCPETITRTYRVTDACGSFVDVEQLIVIQDTQAPVVAAPPAGVTVQCVGDIPAATSLGFTDNCDAPGTVLSTDGPLVGGGCGGTVTRTWTATDACGNVSVPVTQIFTVMDNIPPTAGTPTSMNVQCLGDIPAPDGTVVPSVSDNCTATPTVTFMGDMSNGLTCPETITRTYSITDDCGNEITVDQIFIVNDDVLPTASNPAPINVALVANVPAPNPAVVNDEADNCTVNPIVTWVSDVSDNDICVGETIIRTYSVMDNCGNEIFVTQQITVDPLPIPIDAGPDQTICVGEMLTLTPINPTGGTLTWNPGIASGPFIPDTTATYTVTVDFMGCSASDQVTVVVESPPVVSFASNIDEGCEPLEVSFTNTSTAASGLVNCVWDMNGESVSGCGTVMYTFPSGGTYDVTLTTTSATGCVSTETYTDFIYVESTPVASFSASSEQVSTIETTVEFYNSSTGAVNYQWDFDDYSEVTFEKNPTHDFPTADGGAYDVQLIAISPLGCADTTYLTISVNEELIYYIPNSFTPDGDAFNQYFQPVFETGFDPYDFNMFIYNRWGELMWESHDATVGWDGTYGGEMVSDGIYTWVIEFKTAYSDERILINGHVNVMR